MQAKRVVIYGYRSSEDVDFEHTESGDAVEGTFTPKYFVPDEATKKELTDSGIASSEVILFSEMTPADKDTKIYVIRMIIDISVPIDEITAVNPAYSASTTGVDVNDALHSGQTVTINKVAEGKYDVNDTLRNTFTFDGKNMFYERQYALQTGLNDFSGGTPDEKYLYANDFKYVAAGTNNITGCVATVDSENGAIGLNLYFFDKRMDYKTNGMVKLRNSDVLENK